MAPKWCAVPRVLHHKPSYEIQASIESKGSRRCHHGRHARESQLSNERMMSAGFSGQAKAGECTYTQNTSKGIVDTDSPGHPLLALDRREYLSSCTQSSISQTSSLLVSEIPQLTVLEGHGTLAERVAYREQVHEQHDRCDLARRAAGVIQE